MSNITPHKRLGQVFLKNRIYLSKIIKAAEIKPNDLVLEIGPGTGILTEALLQTGAKVIAIEKDQKMVDFLKNRFQNNKNLTLIQADIRDFLKNQEFKNLKLTVYCHPRPASKCGVNSSGDLPSYKIVGNIPYYLTSHLIQLLLELKQRPKIIVLMIQKEVAQRIISKPPKMNLLALSVQFYSTPKIICFVPKSAFWPKPKVDSAIIKLAPYHSPVILAPYHSSVIATRQWAGKQSQFFQLIKAGFSHPRKLLINNLSYNLKLEPNILKTAFEKINIPSFTRPSELSIDQWRQLLLLLFPK